MVTEKHVCEEPGCNQEAMQCHLLDYGDHSGTPVDVFSWYCTEHATKNGFCWMCGEFWQGNSEFDFNTSHLCPNCQNEVDADTCEVDEEYAPFFDY